MGSRSECLDLNGFLDIEDARTGTAMTVETRQRRMIAEGVPSWRE